MHPLESILEEHGDALYGFLLQLTHSEPDARDLLQEIWRRLARNPDLITPARDPRGFLLRLARNQFLDSLRRAETRSKAHDGAAAEAPQVFEPTDDPDLRQLQDSIALGLAQLPPEQRAVLHLKLWEGQTFEQIAAILDIPQNTAASRYRYALDRLREPLRPLYDELRPS